ncbi:hypothetical protein KUW00_18165 [Halomonas sp. DP5N14-9]|uniref:hypothetical protein n=1 Tax=Halomonas sp. DP5N14-9 TaxID=2859075 RepID=UPI001C992FA8|nr:hypothetical protein [Halomonas sp. DP5N14-9]MBY5942805.1 hypothetical protein [Halomonas sp. DP5N14-9]
MSELNTTPGPWTVHHRMRDCVTFEGKFGTENLFLENLEGYYACQSEPDAHLIAAAPDLYEALAAFERVVDLWLPADCDVDTEHYGEAEALAGLRRTMADALAKARGES